MAALTPALLFGRLRWRLAHALRRRGAGPALLLAGAALLLLAMAEYQSVSQRWQDHLDTAASAAAERARLPTQPAAAATRRAALGAFYQALPDPDDVPGVLQALIELAEQQGLRLLRGSYRLEPEAAAPFARYRMNLPLRGEPALVQRFVQAALLAYPTLAIDSIQFKRDADGVRAFEARVQWVLFVRSAGAEPLAGSRPAAAPVAPAAPAASATEDAVARP